MFRSVKLRKLRLTALSLIGVVLLAAVCLTALRSCSPDTVTIGGERYPLKAQDAADVAAFLTACGYEAPEPVFAHEITVPKQWNDVYTAYNELQQRQGFDLTPYKGRPATEYVYFVSEGRNVTVLVSGKRIIAAHICDCDGGEMRLLTENQ